MWTWGANNDGQLGQNVGTGTHRSSPVQVGTNSWTTAQAGSAWSGAIRSDGTLWVWGNNGSGQLALNDINVSRSSPVQVGTSSWNSIGLGTASGGAIRSDGALFTWGSNSFGQLGQNDVVARSSPVQVGASSWSMISTSGLGVWTGAIRSDGALFTWGAGGNGRSGQNAVTNRSSPVQVGTSSWSFISVGYLTGAAIRSDGTLWAWGSNVYGEVGDGTQTARSSPVQIGTQSWTFVDYSRHAGSSEYNSAGIDSLGKLYGWGRNTNGDVIGDNSVVTQSFGPVQTSAQQSLVDNNVPSSWNQISTSISHIVAIDSTNKLYVWGRNPSSQLGISSSPELSWSQVVVGVSSSAAIRSDGRLFVWGYNTDGVLGDVAIAAINSAVSVPQALGTASWTQAALYDTSMYAIRNDGALFAWGLNGTGQLGLNDVVTRSSPVQVGISFSKITAGSRFAIAVKSNGQLWGWGQNNQGQLGLSDTTLRSSPVQIGTSSWSQVSASEQYALALDVNNKLYGWGYNLNGELGDNTVASKSSPVQIGTSSWTLIYANYSSAAIRSDGALFTWGSNGSGQLGNGTIVNRSSPVQVGTSSWTSVSVASSNMVAIKADGTLWSWGANPNGELGINGAINGLRSSPVQIGSLSNWSKLISSGNHIYINGAIDTAGQMYLWGLPGAGGMIGDNTTTTRSSPVQVGANSVVNIVKTRPTLLDSSSWTQVSAGRSHTLAIKSDQTLWGWGGWAAGVAANTSVLFSSPAQVGALSYTKISAANNSSYAISNTNKLYAWGQNSSGELGLNDVANRSSPVQVGTSNWISVSAGPGFAGAIKQ